MQDFHQELSELRDILEKAELLHEWTFASSYRVHDQTLVSLKLKLSIRSDAHARPAGADFDSAELDFSMALGGAGDFHDIVSCQAQVVIDGLSAQGDLIRFALHFDRHDLSQSSTDLHAHYHWQMGGNKLDGIDFDGLLVLEGPRFPSHPLDPALLIDFVLGHFNGEKRAQLIKGASTRYRQLLHSSQCRYIAPFFSEISAALVAKPFSGTAYWPALCGPA